MKKITLFIFLSFFCIAAIADNPKIDCTPTHSCARTANYLKLNGEIGPYSIGEKACFRCYTSENARLTCPENTLVYTKTTTNTVLPVIHRCTHQQGIAPGAWKRVATIDFCSDSPIKNFNNIANSQNTRLTDDGTKDLTNIEYAVVKNPCYMRNCIANYTYNATTDSCEPDAQPAAQQLFTTTQTTTTEPEPEPEEPVDEYKDIIKKIENEIQDYSKKCSKYTKPQAE